MKQLVVIIIALGIYSCSGQKKDFANNQTKASAMYLPPDSAFIYDNFVYYEDGRYDGIDERWMYEYWQEHPDSALYFFEKATYIKDLPLQSRMAFASYSYTKKGDDRLVKNVLENRNGNDDRSLFYIMESYGIPFSKFGISKEQVSGCCPDIEYQ